MRIHNVKTEGGMSRKHPVLKYGMLALIVVITAFAVVQLVPEGSDHSSAAASVADQNATYDPTYANTYANLYTALQGETNAVANYTAFAAQARAEGYPAVGLLFQATADAEQGHADAEWAVLQSLGATSRPVAYTPLVGTTAQNLQAAVNGETYENTIMYPAFLAQAQADGVSGAARIFNLAMQAEGVHEKNFADVLANLDNAAYLNSNYSTLYRCPVCGEIVNVLPTNCPICGTPGSAFIVYTNTYANLYTALQGEVNAVAKYTAFASQARAEGFPAVGLLFQATADAEQGHADVEWGILQSMGATVMPVADIPVVGTTAENLQAAIDGETHENTIMYPAFSVQSQIDGISAATSIFNRAGAAEGTHAANFSDVLANLGNASYLNNNYSTLYRCPVCGEVVNTLPASGRCPICGTPTSAFITYTNTYANLYTALQGEVNAVAKYTAFAAQARAEGFPAVGLLFQATADAEQGHADTEWGILQGLGATVMPVAETPTVGTTAENLQASIDGEVYENTVMYPAFSVQSQIDGISAATSIFNRAGAAEGTHAANFADVLANLGNTSYLNNNYSTLYRCPVCGEVVNTLPASGRCPICGTPTSAFIVYTNTYANLYTALQGEVNAVAKYTAFAAQARAEGFPAVGLLFQATADAEQGHADTEWGILQSMGATVMPVAETPTVGTTAENLQASIDGEVYENTVMYPAFSVQSQIDGISAATSIFNRAGAAEGTHAANFSDVLANLGNASYLNNNYSTLYRCPVCGEVVNTLPASGRCPICGTPTSAFIVYTNTYANLYTALQGEVNAVAKYTAFAAQARAEGFPAVGLLFQATADAEQGHADTEWGILQSMGATVMPVAETPTVGTTAENLQASIDGEVYENTVMYPAFSVQSQIDGISAATSIFNRAGAAEGTHAANFADVLANLGNASYLNNNYSTLYRCPVCGEVVNTLPASGRCPICGTPTSAFIVYTNTYANLYTALQGEVNAVAKYTAFAAQARAEGFPAVGLLFQATADAEQGHADTEWAILQGLGATVMPVAETPTVGTTAENLQASIDGEVYENTVMYPAFSVQSQIDGISAATSIFNRAGAAEGTHAANFADVLANLGNASYLNNNYSTLYRCPVCGEVVNTLPASGRCPICGTPTSAFIVYTNTYANLYTALQGEVNAVAKYTAFAAQASAEGYPTVALLFQATADAEQGHADTEWGILQSLGATVMPIADIPVVGTTAENLQASIDGEVYENTVMYPAFSVQSQIDGISAATSIFNRAGAAEGTHAANFSDVLANLGNASYLNNNYSTLYRCPVCGEVVNTLPASGRCPICGTPTSMFITYTVTVTTPFVTINGVDVQYTVKNGTVILEPTQDQMNAILAYPGDNIIIDLHGYASIELTAPAGWFKNVDKTFTFITSAGSDTVKTKTLWNNSGKDRVIDVVGGKASIKNA